MADGREAAAGEPRGELADLEAAVRGASQRLVELRETNQQLSRRVRELEAQLAERAAASESGTAERGARRAALETERLEVRRRVEALTRRLDQLAAAAG
jgi:ubiquinone biosynthesis protein UbiJ